MISAIQDWDDAFANMAHVPGSEALPALWTESAAAYRKSSIKIDQNLPYGDHEREKFDIVWPDGTPRGLTVFIHGGYWMRLDKSFWTDFAEGARARGWAVCLPSYTLTPDATIGQITRQMGHALDAAAARVDGPIRLSGHSAGGHLSTRLICDDTPLKPETLARIEKTVSISGVHDLRPLLRTEMNETLRLDEAQAIAESPILRRPATSAPYTCWVGGGERPEFIRQSEIMASIWKGLDANAKCVVDGEHHHFSVIEALKDANSPLTDALVGDL